jgi:hypothetical protein
MERLTSGDSWSIWRWEASGGHVHGEDERATVNLTVIFQQKKREKEGKYENDRKRREGWGGREGREGNFSLLPFASLIGFQNGGTGFERERGSREKFSKKFLISTIIILSKWNFSFGSGHKENGYAYNFFSWYLHVNFTY